MKKHSIIRFRNRPFSYPLPSTNLELGQFIEFGFKIRFTACTIYVSFQELYSAAVDKENTTQP